MRKLTIAALLATMLAGCAAIETEWSRELWKNHDAGGGAASGGSE